MFLVENKGEEETNEPGDKKQMEDEGSQTIKKGKHN